MNKKLDPMCFNQKIGFAITNRGQLLPCCRCDHIMNDNDIEFQKLLAVSNISNYENLNDILQTKEWKRFYKNLSNDIGPPSCYKSCGVDRKEKQISYGVDPSTKENLIHSER